jgi:hypothetical protein
MVAEVTRPIPMASQVASVSRPVMPKSSAFTMIFVAHGEADTESIPLSAIPVLYVLKITVSLWPNGHKYKPVLVLKVWLL